MTHHFHHVPGRLRVKSSLLRGNASDAQRVCERMRQLRGVTAVEVSTITGSVIVRYDAVAVTGEALLKELHTLGITSDAIVQHPGQVAGPGNGSAAAERIAQQLANRIVETLIERSAVALIGALI